MLALDRLRVAGSGLLDGGRIREGYERIASKEKWLFTHGRRKWETFYSPEARELQRRFFDRYLKGLDNQWERTPRVRLEVRTARNAYRVRPEAQWPLESVRYEAWHQDAATQQLNIERCPDEAAVSYEPTRTGAEGRVRLMRRFERETELTGSMTLKLWVSTSDGDDLDLFVVLRKWDAAGREVRFYGYNGFDKDGVARSCRSRSRSSRRARCSGKGRASRSTSSVGTPIAIRPFVMGAR